MIVIGQSFDSVEGAREVAAWYLFVAIRISRRWSVALAPRRWYDGPLTLVREFNPEFVDAATIQF